LSLLLFLAPSVHKPEVEARPARARPPIVLWCSTRESRTGDSEQKQKEQYRLAAEVRLDAATGAPSCTRLRVAAQGSVKLYLFNEENHEIHEIH
jgi:hypothetical protein